LNIALGDIVVELSGIKNIKMIPSKAKEVVAIPLANII
jgi:hypothetical protein